MARLSRNKTYKSNIQRIREDVYRTPNKKQKTKTLDILSNDFNEVIHKENVLTIFEHLCIIRQQLSDEGCKPGDKTSIQEGFIYLIANPIWDGWVKAGMTVDYEDRLSNYNIYDPCNMYSYIDIKWTNDRKHAEKYLLNVLKIHSNEYKGEWFKINIDKAKALMHTTV